VTKIEKTLVHLIKDKIRRKGMDFNPLECYEVIKHSNKQYICKIRIGNEFIEGKGKDKKTAIKSAINEL